MLCLLRLISIEKRHGKEKSTKHDGAYSAIYIK